jgi:ABC-type uncharacterized transport system fused permease/ATPase subunit
MFGDSITLTVNAIAKTLKKINQDSYSSEYLLREADGEHRLTVRHSAEKALIQGEKMERHNVEYRRTVFGTSPDDGYQVVVSSTLRNPQRITGAEVDQYSDALADWVKANGILLVGWES